MGDLNVDLLNPQLTYANYTGCHEYTAPLVPSRWTKLSRKVLYHFVMLATINEILTFKNSRICPSPRPIIAESMAHRAREPRGEGLTVASI